MLDLTFKLNQGNQLYSGLQAARLRHADPDVRHVV